MNCPECTHPITPALSRCPHCGRPALFPNVRAAEQPEQRAALQARYDEVVRDAAGRGASAAVDAFEVACTASRAVMARSLGEVERLARSDHEGYATYYQLTNAESRIPGGDAWDQVRRLADDALHPGYREEIRFAALSLDGNGPTNYGECSVVLRNDMIEHRATVFEENSVLFLSGHGVRFDEVEAKIRGRRASWADRAKLCVAKLAQRINPTTDPSQHSSLLLTNGATSSDDSFVEVHVFGSMTARTFEKVRIAGSRAMRAKGRIRGLGEQLGRLGVMLEVLR